MASREYDMVIYGATGYTARLTLDYLASSPSMAGYKWAIAGRTKSKLEALLAEKQQELDAANKNVNKIEFTKIPIIIASSDDEASLNAMCQQTKVLLAMAGPFILCGLPVVGACVRSGTHYMDITGEIQFIRRAIELYHDEAEAKKVAIVTTCGFDCVPSDIGSFMMHDCLSRIDSSDKITDIAAYFDLRRSLMPSGGTAHSLVNMAKTITMADLSRISLNPQDARVGVPTPMQKFVGWSSFVKRYTAPFVMAAGNERTVRRSNALLGRPTMSYWEAATAPSLLAAVKGFVSIVSMGICMSIPPLRDLAAKYVLPKQGDGPSAESKLRAEYTVTFHAKTQAGRELKGTFGVKQNPYDSTGVLVAEAAATMLEMLKENAPIRGGVIPPAVAFGDQYMKRLMAPETGVAMSAAEITKSK